MALNTKQLAAMEEQFRKLQEIEIGLLGEDAETAKLIAKYAAMPALYSDPAKLDELLKELEAIITKIAGKSIARGSAMSEKTMANFLEKSERASRKMVELDRIARMNEAKATARLNIYKLELQKEFSAMKADIGIFIQRGRLEGFTDKELLKQLVQAGHEQTGFIQAFTKKAQKLDATIARREETRREFDEYRKAAQPGEEWEWVTISTKPCPDCQARAGTILPLTKWEQIGLPGDGRTVCGQNCMCKLYPVSISDELFDEVKEFEWDKNSGVLLTAAEARELRKGQA